MSSVKITDKTALERLSAQIFLQTGKKFTQQELLSICVDYSLENLEILISKIAVENRKWTQEEIKDLKENYIEDLGEGTENLSKNIDDIIYGDKNL